VYTPNSQFTHSRSEFAHPRTTNSLGLAEREIPFEKSSNEYRIVAVGDSYTEGVGADYTDSWVKVLERRLAAARPDRTFAAFNAGISGSDPWFEYMLLKEKLVTYRPDLVLMAINASDMGDGIIRGGPERFLPDGTTRSRPTPSWEWLYGASFLFRHVIHDVLGYNTMFVRDSEWVAEQRKAGDQLVAACAAAAKLGYDRGFPIVVVLHPNIREASIGHYERNFASVVQEIKALPGLEVVDVLEYWTANGILAREGVSTLYWSLDGHNTPKGYASFGEAVATGLLGLSAIWK
jgi:lysophospholipase L1-like esterase